MPSDAQLTDPQRAAAIDTARENVALRSGAGCGKTFVLARRFLTLLQRGRPGRAPDEAAEDVLSRFVALTFTNKAALEMSTRVRSMLDERARAATGEERARMLAWLEQMPEARISTIDGFCSSLLRAHAVEAGVDPSFSVCADELLASRMVADAAERAVLAAVESQRENVGGLLGDMGFDAVVHLVEQLMNQRLACDLSSICDADALLARWREILDANRAKWLAPLATDPDIRTALDGLAAIPCDDPEDKLAVVRDKQIRAVRDILDDPAAATVAKFAAVPASGGSSGSAKAWGDKEAVKDVRARIKRLASAVAEYAEFAEDIGPADERAAGALAALANLAVEAGELYAADKRNRGMLDFADLIYHAHKLLAGNAELRKAVGAGIEQLLIDECQDTNRFQLETLAMLIGGGTPEQAPPDGRLFAVGDAKQSIYRFRGAQVEVFGRMCEALGSDHQLYLDESFRTHEAGVAIVNELFAPLMGDAFAPTKAYRKQVPDAPSVEFLLAAPAPGDGGTEPEPIASADASARLQADACAQRIAEILDGGERLVWDSDAKGWRPARAGDIAILFARMSNSLLYERALQQRGIPYYVVAGMGFFQRQEVFDVLTALGAADNPLDDISLVGMLRGGLVGLSDNAMMHLATALEPPYWPGLVAMRKARPSEPCLADRLAPAEADALTRAVDLISRLHRVKDSMAIDELLRELLDETGYETALLSQFQGRRMLSNVRQVAERAAAASADHLSLADFLAEMRGMVADESRYEQAAVAGEHENVVRLMTIHKAKGLEFPVVIVPDLNAGRRGHASRLLIRDDWGATFNRPAAADADEGDAAKPLSFRLANRLEAADGRAEDFRKLYVAATRHEDHLIFLGADYRSKDGALRDSHSYIAAIDGVMDLTGALDAATTGGADLRCEIPYAKGKFRALVRRLSPVPPADRAPGGSDGQGRKILDSATGAADLAERIIKAGRGPSELPLVGPLPTTVGQVEIAVTALNDFETCPMLYRWRHELRLPRCYEALMRGDVPADADAGDRHFDEPPTKPTSFDAATIGTLYHKCMELLDVSAPQAADVLVGQAAAVLDMEPSPALDALATEFAPMREAFSRHALAAALRSARQVRRELDFVLPCPPAEVRGQIDLIFQDAEGAWHIVDYKSDRVADPKQIAEHAGRYELQLMLYAQAAGLHLGEPVADATLYFLRPAATFATHTDATALTAGTDRARRLAAELIAARRADKFEHHRGDHCQWCSYAGLCSRST